MASRGRLRIGVRIPVRVRVSIGLAATAVVAVVSGCATLPSGGRPQQVDTGGNQVQAYVQPLPPPGPKSYHQPGQVVLAFLHASASFAFDPKAARQFLLPALRATWRPGPVTVVNNRINPPQRSAPPGRLDASSAAGPTVSVVLHGQQLATLSPTGQYQYSPGTRTYQFSLQRVNGVWLISALPSQNTLLLTQADFQLVYQARSLFFFSLPFRPEISSLVPDPVYAPLWNSDSALNSNLASGLVRGLLNDRGSWVSGATATAFPHGTTLLGIGISGQTAVVNLGGAAVHATAAQRQGMAQQLEATLGSAAYSPALAHTVQLEIKGRRVGSGPFAINLIDDVPRGQLVYESSPGSVSEGLGRPPSLGSAQLGSADITAIAMAPTGGAPQAGAVAVAVKDGKGCAVYKRNTQTGPPRGPYRATALSTTGGSCTSLSWDSSGNLWAAAGRTIWMLAAQGNRWQAVALPASLRAGGKPGPLILALRMAPDGVRAALLIKYGSHRRLVLAAVREQGTQVWLERPVAAESGLSDPMAVSWFSPYALLVLDRLGIAEVPLASGAAQRLSPTPTGADSLTTDGVTIVIGTANEQMQVSRPVAAASTEISWQRPAIGANPIYPG